MQRDRFRSCEADAWFKRNEAGLLDREAAQAADPLLRVLRDADVCPSDVLEVGAGNGWRLSSLSKTAGARCHGIEPSAEAVAAGRRADPTLNLIEGTAERLPFQDSAFDLVMFGFCLYLCDPADLFRIAGEADRVLKDGGHVAIYDFYAETPYRRTYSHAPGLFSHKMNFARLFDWHPAYRVTRQDVLLHPGGSADNPDDQTAVTLLRKDLVHAFPLTG
jgi:SAM-dependent methyltransferase